MLIVIVRSVELWNLKILNILYIKFKLNEIFNKFNLYYKIKIVCNNCYKPNTMYICINNS